MPSVLVYTWEAAMELEAVGFGLAQPWHVLTSESELADNISLPLWNLAFQKNKTIVII